MGNEAVSSSQGFALAIAVDVWLYGPLARYGNPEAALGTTPLGPTPLYSTPLYPTPGSAYANVRLDLADGSTMADLLARLGLPTEERGITFVNGCLSALPGVQPDLAMPLRDGDRIAFFHLKSMWPYQYRDGAAATAELARTLAPRSGPVHHRTAESSPE